MILSAETTTAFATGAVSVTGELPTTTSLLSSFSLITGVLLLLRATLMLTSDASTWVGAYVLGVSLLPEYVPLLLILVSSSGL